MSPARAHDAARVKQERLAHACMHAGRQANPRDTPERERRGHSCTMWRAISTASEGLQPDLLSSPDVKTCSRGVERSGGERRGGERRAQGRGNITMQNHAPVKKDLNHHFKRRLAGCNLAGLLERAGCLHGVDAFDNGQILYTGYQPLCLVALQPAALASSMSKNEGGL